MLQRVARVNELWFRILHSGSGILNIYIYALGQADYDAGGGKDKTENTFEGCRAFDLVVSWPLAQLKSTDRSLLAPLELLQLGSTDSGFYMGQSEMHTYMNILHIYIYIYIYIYI